MDAYTVASTLRIYESSGESSHLIPIQPASSGLEVLRQWVCADTGLVIPGTLTTDLLDCHFARF
jgi:hypothetical protein